VKHLKPYKIFESNTRDESNTEIMEVLSHVADHGYDIKIYDFYYYGRAKDDINTETHVLSTNIANIHEDWKKSKLIKITNRDSPSKWFNVNEFAKLGFNSSSFHFNGDFIKYREFFLDLMDSVSQFSDRSPKLCFKDTDNILILLEYETVTKEELETKKIIGELYDKLRLVLSNSMNHGGKRQYDLVYLPQVRQLKISPRGGDGQIYSYKIISTLCPQLKDQLGYGWMNREEYKPIDNPDFRAIKDLLDDFNCEVKFTTQTVSGSFNDDIIFTISKKE